MGRRFHSVRTPGWADRFKGVRWSLLVIFFIFPPFSFGAEWTLEPSIELTGEYNDNVRFSRLLDQGDFLATLKPGISMDYKTDVLKLRSLAAVGLLRYADQKELDTENLWFDLLGSYLVSERWEFSGGFSYIKDTTLQSEYQETGIVVVRDDRKRTNGNAGLKYLLSELSDMGVNYTHSTTEYDFRGNVDYTQDTVSLSYNRMLENSRDVFTLRPYFFHIDSDTSMIDNYGLSVGWAHDFSETLKLTAFLGGRYTEVEFTRIQAQVVLDPTLNPPFRVIFREFKESDSNLGYVADIALSKTGETYEASVGYTRDLSFSGVGEPVNTDRLYFSTRRRISSRFWAQFTGSVYSTQSNGDVTDTDTRSYDVVPSLSYRITEEHTVTVGYGFTRYEDRNLNADSEVDRNRVWLSLDFRFPKKW